MSTVMNEEVKHWTAKRKSALVLENPSGQDHGIGSSRQIDLPPSEIEDWVEQARYGMENALRAKPEDVRQAV